MRNLLLFGSIVLIMLTSLIIGTRQFNKASAAAAESAASIQADIADDNGHIPPMPSAVFGSDVPHIGSVQVLNGCGAEGAATRVAEFLRSKNFDVKDIGNAPTYNHPATMIVSRNKDMGLANEIDRFMKTGKVVMIRNGEQLYDVTVIAGPDFEDRIRQ